MIFDTHAHYDDERFNEDRRELLGQLPCLCAGRKSSLPDCTRELNGNILSKAGGCPARGQDDKTCNIGKCGANTDNTTDGKEDFSFGCVGKVINVASTIDSIEDCVSLAKEFPHVYAAFGVHPSELEGMNEDVIDRIESLCRLEKTVAIGEIGLDYYWEKEPKAQENQKYWFVRQLELAKEVKLPVVIHSRDAAADTLSIVKEHGADLSGVIHCYSYSPELAREYVKMGYYIGVGGVVTFKNAKKLVQTVEETPMERLLLETDSPYLCPEPHRGHRNDSRELKYVVKKISQIKGISEKEIEDITWENACRLFPRVTGQSRGLQG